LAQALDKGATMTGGRGLGPGKLRRLASGRYLFSYRDAERRQRRVLLSEDRRTAERMRAEIIQKRDLEERGLGSQEGMERPLAEVVASYLAEIEATRAAATAKRQRDELKAATAFLGPRRVRDVTATLVMEWRRERMKPQPPKQPGGKERRGVSVRTANMGGAILKTCLEWARRGGLIAANPLADLRRLANPEATWRKRRRSLTEKEVGTLLAGAAKLDAKRAALWAAERTIAAGTKGAEWNAKRREQPISGAPLWRTFLSVGLRLGEAISATWQDYDDAERVLSLRPGNTKARTGRDVPIPKALAADLTALRRAQALARGRPTLGTDPIFTTPHGLPWDPANVRREFRAVLKAAGMKPTDERGRSLDVHGLRVAATTRMLRHGVPIPIVMEIVGHRDAKVTLRHYTDLRLADTRAALDTMPSASVSSGTEERRSAAVGDGQPGSIRDVLDAADDELSSFSERSRGDSNARPAVPKTDALSS
jgi:integrase